VSAHDKKKVVNSFFSGWFSLEFTGITGQLFVYPKSYQAGTTIPGILRRKNLTRTSQRRKRGDYMPTSKKQIVKLNQVKKAEAEEVSKQAAAGSQEARKKLKKLGKKRK
jgi:hypothetical protein